MPGRALNASRCDYSWEDYDILFLCQHDKNNPELLSLWAYSPDKSDKNLICLLMQVQTIDHSIQVDSTYNFIQILRDEKKDDSNFLCVVQ